ncbi:MAG: GNAT family N-acetyltransferase, partial [Anaerolineae bacterium]
PKRLIRRYDAEQGYNIIGNGITMLPDTAVTRLHFAIHLSPQWQTDALIDDFYNHIIDSCQKHDPIGFTVKIREDESAKADWLTRNGFQPVMRYPLSILNLAEFDLTPYAHLADKMAAQNIEIVPVAELSERDADWQRRIYELDVSVTEDTPSPHPYTHAPFPLYAQSEFEDPNFMPEAWFVALANGQYVGMTNLGMANEAAKIMHTYFTGVRRDYRRRGIALALKVRAIQFAQNLGARLILTNNEENNPMYLMNLALGFQPQPADVDWERSE